MKGMNCIFRIAIVSVWALSAIMILSCEEGKPDLTMDENMAVPFTIDWDQQKAIANIFNAGSASAGEFLVYFEISDAGSSEPARPESQATRAIPGLSVGEKMTIEVPLDQFSIRSFDPTTATQGFLEVRIDAKIMVEESNEDNNYYSGVF